MQNRVNYINKQDFLKAYLAAYKETITLANIHSSFAAAGLVPYNPKRVLSKLHTQLKTPTLPPPSAIGIEQGPWVLETPHNSTQLELQSKAIKGFLNVVQRAY